MKISAQALIPGSDQILPGMGAYADDYDHELREKWRRSETIRTAIRRGASDDFDAWLEHVSSAAGCSRPVQLKGSADVIDPTTGEIIVRTTSEMPDQVIYKACGNRRASVCPACAEVYRADTYQLVLAGLNGGKGVPATIQQHPCAFPTFTAPSFGPVHSTRRTADGRRRMCRPGRTPKICPHGVDLRCFTIHGDHEKCLGTALCLDCYDYDRQVVWNVMAGELWRRTIDRAKATLRRWARNHGGSMRLSFAKVAEMQARGVAHFHALVRIDGHDPSGDDAFPIPHLAADYALLDHALTDAARNTRFRTPPHADHPEGWLIEWGREFKVLPVRMSAAGEVTETQVAGYLAKYATKSTEATGHISQRVTEETVGLYFEEDGHAARMLEACWRLGRPGSDLDPSVVERNSRLSFERLRRWAHMLGFGGHFSTKSRLYSTTLRALREARALWRQEHYRTADHMAEETTLLVGSFTFADSGWRTLGDALLANTAAAMAREHRRTVEDELQFFAQIHSQSASKQPRSE